MCHGFWSTPLVLSTSAINGWDKIIEISFYFLFAISGTHFKWYLKCDKITIDITKGHSRIAWKWYHPNDLCCELSYALCCMWCAKAVIHQSISLKVNERYFYTCVLYFYDSFVGQGKQEKWTKSYEHTHTQVVCHNNIEC